MYIIWAYSAQSTCTDFKSITWEYCTSLELRRGISNHLLRFDIPLWLGGGISNSRVSFTYLTVWPGEILISHSLAVVVNHKPKSIFLSTVDFLILGLLPYLSFQYYSTETIFPPQVYVLSSNDTKRHGSTNHSSVVSSYTCNIRIPCLRVFWINERECVCFIVRNHWKTEDRLYDILIIVLYVRRFRWICYVLPKLFIFTIKWTNTIASKSKVC